MESLNQAAPFISAIAAVCSAAAAVSAVWFSRQPSTRERIDILKDEILGFVATEQGQKAWIKINTLSSSTSVYGGPKIVDLAKILKRKYRKDKWVRLLPAALEELKIEKHTPDDAEKEASDYIEKTISNIKSDIYAMCIIHGDNFDNRSPLSLDKFKEITQYVSKLADLNIKHFLSQDIATVFFRMHESNDGSNMTIRIGIRENITTQEDALNTQVVCNIMPFNQWVDAVVAGNIYDNEGVRIATEIAESVKCPICAHQAHTFLSEFVSHTQMEVNNIRELARQGQATPDMNTPYSMLFLPNPKEGDEMQNCSMWDIAKKVDSLINAQW